MRSAKRWSQTDLAKQLSVSQPQVSRWERGAAIAERDQQKLSKILGLTQNDPVPFIAASTVRDRWIPDIVPLLDASTIKIEAWQRPQPGESGDFLVGHQMSRDTVLLVAGDIAGHGMAASRRALFVSAWCRGWLAAQNTTPRLTTVLSALDEESSRERLQLGVALAAFTLERESDVSRLEVICAGFPAPVVLTGPPYKTPVPTIESSVGRLGRYEGTRYNYSLRGPWQMALVSDGLLQRIGVGVEQKGRRQIRSLQTRRSVGQPLDSLIGESKDSQDDESLLMVEMARWDHTQSIDMGDQGRSSGEFLTWVRTRAEQNLGRETALRLVQAVAMAIENASIYTQVPEIMVRVRFELESTCVEVMDRGGGTPKSALATPGAGIAVIKNFSPQAYFRKVYPSGTLVGVVLSKEEN